MERLELFFANFDWDGFWLNVLVSAIFFIFSMIVAIKVIPYFTIKLIQKKNKVYIDRRVIAVVQEICRFLNKAPYKDQELHHQSLSIFTSIPEDENYQFAGFVKINVLSEILRIKMYIIVNEYFMKFTIKDRHEALKKENIRLKEFRNHIENIIGFHSLHLDEEILSEVSEICLDIRSFEISFEFNKTLEELFPENGNEETPGVSGIGEVSGIYQKLLEVLNRIIKKSKFKTELKS